MHRGGHLNSNDEHLGVESSCDETGVALVTRRRSACRRCARKRCTARSTCTRPTAACVPELASRDHIRRVLPLTRQVLAGAARRSPMST
jgi:N6-L-threonylcarbamoyladenine synthase